MGKGRIDGGYVDARVEEGRERSRDVEARSGRKGGWVGRKDAKVKATIRIKL